MRLLLDSDAPETLVLEHRGVRYVITFREPETIAVTLDERRGESNEIPVDLRASEAKKRAYAEALARAVSRQAGDETPTYEDVRRAMDDPEVQENLHALALDFEDPDVIAKIVEAAIAAGLIVGPSAEIYDSLRRGKISIKAMNQVHARRAATLVRKGERSGGRKVARQLEKQARSPKRGLRLSDDDG